MEKETPEENLNQACVRVLKEMNKETPTEETVVHPKTNLIVDYLDNAMGVECDNADWTYINEILLSHDAELRRKIEGMRKDNVYVGGEYKSGIPTGMVCRECGSQEDCPCATYNRALDAVLDLLGKENV